MKPKKPNSALRKIVKVLLNNNKIINAYIPGEYSEIIKNSKILLIPKPIKDCPGIKYRVIRGARDVKGVKNRKSSRSKYGTKSE